MTLANRGMLFSHKVVRVRKKPVEVDAMQWSGSLTSADQIIAWAIENGVGPGMRYVRPGDLGVGHTIEIPTLENVMAASPGDWIIKGVEGEFYPCKPSIFEKTYEFVGKRYPS